MSTADVEELRADLLAGLTIFAAVESLNDPDRFERLLDSDEPLSPDQLDRLENVLSTGGLIARESIKDFFAPVRKHGRITLRRLRESIERVFCKDKTE